LLGRLVRGQELDRHRDVVVTSDPGGEHVREHDVLAIPRGHVPRLDEPWIHRVTADALLALLRGDDARKRVDRAFRHGVRARARHRGSAGERSRVDDGTVATRNHVWDRNLLTSHGPRTFTRIVVSHTSVEMSMTGFIASSNTSGVPRIAALLNTM
jgi:hypothetical protein